MTWTALRSYEGVARRAISLPVGGIGTGTVGFGGRGQLRDWELENHPAKGTRSTGSFFACRVAQPGRSPDAFLLESQLFEDEVEGALGSPVPVSGLKRFANGVFETTYPFGRVRLTDPEAPVAATVEAWNPLVPGEEDPSGLPIAVFVVTLHSMVPGTLDVSVMFSVEDLVGHRLRARRAPEHSSKARVDVHEGPEASKVLLGDSAMDSQDEEWGTLAAGVLGPAHLLARHGRTGDGTRA